MDETVRTNEPGIRLKDSAFIGHTRQYDSEILYYDSPESDIYIGYLLMITVTVTIAKYI